MSNDLHTLGRAMRDALHAAMNDTPGWYDLARDAIAAFDKALNEPAKPARPSDSTAIMLLREVNLQGCRLPQEPRLSTIKADLVDRIEAFLKAADGKAQS